MALRDLFGPKQQVVEYRSATEESKKFGGYQIFAGTDFAKNNIFIYDDLIQGVNRSNPLFALRGEFPFTRIESFQHHAGNSYEYFPDISDVDDVVVELYETEDVRVWEYFENWQSKIFHENGTYNLPDGANGFKKDLWVYRLDIHHSRVFGLYYTGVWPKMISPYSPDNSSADAYVCTITFSADDVKILKVGDTTAISKNKDIERFIRDDSLEAWGVAQQKAQANVAETRAAIEANKPLREKIYEKTVIRPNIAPAIAKQLGIEEDSKQMNLLKKVGRKTEVGAWSLYFSKGQRMTNLGF